MGVANAEGSEPEGGEDRTFSEVAHATCANMRCIGQIVDMDFVNEDADMISYAGACTNCGAEYNLVHMKEES